MIEVTGRGLYCGAGDFYIDPWQPVERAVITHAHSDHARPGCGAYLTADPGVGVLRERLGPEARIESAPYGHPLRMNGLILSFHPAGHILGSAQVRIEQRGQVCVVGGDYKRQPDPTCAAFEPVRCHTFLTESTYALPIYRWPNPEDIFAEINEWWRHNQELGRTSIVYAYSLGKAQRLLAGVDAGIGPIHAHGAVERFVPVYRAAGVKLPALAGPEGVRGRGLVIAPPSARGSPWLRRFGESSTAFVSGWMQIRGARRRRNVDRGFVLSDHSDWNGLLETIRDTEAESVGVLHGYTAVLARWLAGQGLEARAIPAQFEGDAED